MRFLLLLPFTLLLMALSVGYSVALWKGLGTLLSEAKFFVYVGLGSVCYFGFLLLLRVFHRSIGFAHTFCHELNHAVFNVLFLNRIRSFNAHAEEGGDVEFYGRANPLICLAPYSVPLFALIALSVKLFALPSAYPVIEGFVGFFVFFHLHSFFKEARPYQTDLQRYGVLFSYAVILFMNVVLISWVVISAALGFAAGWEFLKSGIFEIWDIWNKSRGAL